MKNQDVAALPKRANLGCGWDKRGGFLNIDMHENHFPDLVGDVVSLPDLPSGYFDYLLAQDVLEHLERTKVPIALTEWARLLAPNGILELRTLSVLHLLQLLARPEYRPAEKAAEIIHLMYGTQAYTGDYHLVGFTPTLMVKLLRDAGMLICKVAIRDDWLFDITARKTHVLIDPEELVYQAYFEILDRPADAAGLLGFTAALQNGTLTVEGLRDALINSSEGQFLQSRPSYLVPHNGETIKF